MKKIFLSLIIFASIAVSVNAQHRGLNDRKGKSDFPTKELNLTEEQKSKIKSINEDYKSKTFAVRSDSTLTKEQRRTKTQELRKEQRLAANNVLTAEQQATLKEVRAKKTGNDIQRKGIAQNRIEMHRVAKNPFEGLNLTEDQKAQIKTLNDDFRSKGREDMKKHREAIAKILTPEQQNQLKSRREELKNSPRKDRKVDPEVAKKLETLRTDYLKEKQAVEMSRIAPEEQTRRINELKKKYIEDRIKIKKDVNKL